MVFSCQNKQSETAETIPRQIDSRYICPGIVSAAGDRKALAAIIRRWQGRVFRLTLRMAGRREDAEDLTQEILVKIVTGLSSLAGRSSFATWAYRIAVNHNLNARRNSWERYFQSFASHERLRHVLDRAAPAPSEPTGAERAEMLEEFRNQCLSGMLLSLDRRKRTALILGTLFGLEAAAAARVMETTPANFRQLHSRARKLLAAYIGSDCGFLHPAAACRCENKLSAARRMGVVGKRPARRQAPVSIEPAAVDDALSGRLAGFFRSFADPRSPALERFVRRLLALPSARAITDFNGGKADA